MLCLPGRGKDVKVEVFTDSEKVDLFLNGKKVGSQKVEEMKVLFASTQMEKRSKEQASPTQT